MARMLKKLVALVVVVAIALTMSVPVFAASGRPYKDVIKNKTVEPQTYSSIKYLKKHHAYDGIVKGKYLYPDKIDAWKKTLKVLINLYGKKNVPITKTDKKRYKKPTRQRWLIDKLNAISKKMGGGTFWWYPPMNLKVSRGNVASFIYGFLVCEEKLKPKK